MTGIIHFIAYLTFVFGKSDKKIKLKLLDPPPFPNFPYEEYWGGGVIVVTGLTKDLFLRSHII